MIPAKCRGGISPVEIKRFIQTQQVFPKIAREINRVVLIQLIIRFGVQVVKIQCATFEGSIRRKFKDGLVIPYPVLKEVLTKSMEADIFLLNKIVLMISR